MTKPQTLLLTALLEEESQGFFEQQRRQYYPTELNIVPSHLMLFHNLPLTAEKEIGETLNAVCSQRKTFDATVTGIDTLGRGVAYRVEAPLLSTIQNELATKWQAWLIPQDRQKYRPHIVIQNKVTVDSARNLHAALSKTFVPFSFPVAGLTLWAYCSGPWQKITDYRFLADT